jgi:DNA-binding PadR family transcriptional regulator
MTLASARTGIKWVGRNRYPRTVAHRSEPLSPGDWAVLGVVAESPTHGFAVARVMTAEGGIGRIWTLPRPAVYASLNRLQELGLTRVQAVRSGDRGPDRSIIAVTPAGLRMMQKWLYEPVRHVRDVRSMLLLKLVLLDRARVDPAPLVEAQLAVVAPQLNGLRHLRDQAVGFERVLAAWRVESSEAVVRFLTDGVTQGAPSAP